MTVREWFRGMRVGVSATDLIFTSTTLDLLLSADADRKGWTELFGVVLIFDLAQWEADAAKVKWLTTPRPSAKDLGLC